MKLNKVLTYFGRTLIIIGVVYLIKQPEGFYGYGGYVDNSLETIIIGTALIILGIVTFRFCSRSGKM